MSIKEAIKRVWSKLVSEDEDSWSDKKVLEYLQSTAQLEGVVNDSDRITTNTSGTSSVYTGMIEPLQPRKTTQITEKLTPQMAEDRYRNIEVTFVDDHITVRDAPTTPEVVKEEVVEEEDDGLSFWEE